MTDHSFKHLKESDHFTRSVLIVRASKVAYAYGDLCLIQVDNDEDREALLCVEREKLKRNNDGLLVRKGVYEYLRNTANLQDLDPDEQVDNIFYVKVPPNRIVQVGPSKCSLINDSKRFFACGRKNIIFELQIKNLGPETFDGHDPEKGKCDHVWTVNVVMYTNNKDWNDLIG